MKPALSLLAAALFVPALAIGAGTRDYQVTGPVLDVTPDAITVEKDKEKWEIARTKDTKIEGDLKKGSRVTIKTSRSGTTRRRDVSSPVQPGIVPAVPKICEETLAADTEVEQEQFG